MTEIFLQNRVVELLKTVMDPEFGINIWDFGLIYGILVKELANNSKIKNIQIPKSEIKNGKLNKNLREKIPEIKQKFTEKIDQIKQIETKSKNKNLTKKSLNFSEDLAGDLAFLPEFSCHILMTFTSVNCPAIDSLPIEIKQKITELGFFARIEIEIVWEPKWEIALLSEEIQFELGLL